MTKPIALITGVGPVTGTALSRRLSAGGYRVAMLSRNAERLKSLEWGIHDSHAFVCDVADETQIDTALDAVHKSLGTPDVFIHNAVGGAFGNFMEIDPSILNGNFQVNTMALLHFSRRLAPAMIAAGSGSIIVTGKSQGTSRAWPTSALYRSWLYFTMRVRIWICLPRSVWRPCFPEMPAKSFPWRWRNSQTCEATGTLHPISNPI